MCRSMLSVDWQGRLFEGMMLHQDGSRHAWLEGQPMLDLIVTMDDATSTLYSAFLIEEEGTASSFQGLLETLVAKGLPPSTNNNDTASVTSNVSSSIATTHPNNTNNTSSYSRI